MKSQEYIKIAKILDESGKYKQADNVDKFLKVSQFTAETYAESGPTNPYAGGYFSGVKGKLMQSGLNAQLMSGGNSFYGSGSNSIVGLKPLDPRQVALILTQPGGKEYIQAYMVQLGEKMIADAANYTGPQKLELIINNVFVPALQSVPVNMIDEFYTNNMENVIISEIKNIIQNGTVQNLQYSINVLRNIKIPLIFSRTIPAAIKEALKNMSLDNSPTIQQKLYTFANSAIVKQFVPNYLV